MPEALEHQIVEMLTYLFQTMGWTGVVIIMTLESANIPIPSEVTMPLAGWMLSEALGKSPWHAVFAGGFFGALGCTLGSVGSYALGYYGGRPLAEKYGRYLLIGHDDLDKATRWFERWGDWASFLSRLLPIVRTFISFPAGALKTRFWTFALYTFVGSFIWCSALAWGGYVFGSHWEELRAIMRPFDIPIAIIILLGGGWYVWKHVKEFRAAGKQARAEKQPEG